MGIFVAERYHENTFASLVWKNGKPGFLKVGATALLVNCQNSFRLRVNKTEPRRPRFLTRVLRIARDDDGALAGLSNRPGASRRTPAKDKVNDARASNCRFPRNNQPGPKGP